METTPDYCLNAGMPIGSPAYMQCAGYVYSLDRTNSFRRIWGLPPLDELPKDGPPRAEKHHADAHRSTSITKPLHAPKVTRQHGCGSCGQPSKPRVVPPMRPDGWGPGSKLLETFERMGLSHCEACSALAAKMDAWGKAECASRLDAIVDDMMPRAEEHVRRAMPVRNAIGELTGTKTAAIRGVVAAKVVEAIEAASDRITVAIWTNSLRLGGAERWCMDLATNLNGPQIRVSGLCVNARQADADLLAKSQAAVDVYFGNECKNVIKESDILLCWGSSPPVLAEHASVYCSHGCGPWMTTKLKTLRLDSFEFTAVSQPAADILKRPAAIIYNGSDPGRLVKQNDARKQFKIGDDKLVVGYVGRPTLDKRAQAAIEGANALTSQGTPAVAMIVGGRINGFRGSKQTIFVPRTEQLGDLYAAMDCFVLASPSEGFSLSMIEAWLCGVPVVATPVGAVEELEAQYGQLVRRVPVGATAAQLADAIREAVSPEFDEVVQKAQRIAEKEFTVDAMAKRWTDYLTSLI